MARSPLQQSGLVVTPLGGAAGRARGGGIDLRGVDRAVDDGAMRRLRQVFLDHCVLVFPGQQTLTTDEFVTFSSRWGESRARAAI